ncbi:MAG: DUF374 domain-containing protein [Rhodospirillales bacterium]|jgi:lysophospholipid acyltransferase (LPLAT)-like uncharacterized protein|nr:DUF374 domain-containing protein [Rhodospirillales bacterium]
MFKRLMRKPFVQAMGAWLLGLYLAFVYATTRWRMIGHEQLPGLLAQHPTVIAGFWHERLPLMPALWRRARRGNPALERGPCHVLVSRHRDGRFIGQVVRRFEIEMVNASSSRGGAIGLRVLLRQLRDGAMVVITPDGPRGPRRRAAPGIAQLAAASGMPVLPTAAAASHHIRLKSWDRMMLPLPFGRGVVCVGAPILVPRDGAEAALPSIEAALSEIVDAADRALGIAPL